LLLVFCLPVMLSFRNDGGDDAWKRQHLLWLACQYSPDAEAILREVGNYPFEKFAHGSEPEVIARDFGTVVHEACHKVNQHISRGNSAAQGIFIAPGVRIRIPEGPVYNSRELNRFVPDSLKQAIFRYDTYIGSRQTLISSQINGIYGIMDEFCAYYHDTRASLDLYDYYLEKVCRGYRNSIAWADYLGEAAATVYAYYEFNLFISWYLQYARLRHPEVYKSCMENMPLRVAYTLLDDMFGQLVADYYAVRSALLASLNRHGEKVMLEEDLGGEIFMKVYYDNGNILGVGLPENKMRLLRELLMEKEHTLLDDFRIEGVTVRNFRDFFEG